MQKTCTNCGDTSVSVPMVVVETEAARHERNLRRIWIALIVAISMIFVSNALWLLAWMQYDYASEEVVITQDAGDGGNANFIGGNGEIVNGEANDNNPTENENEKNE